MENKNYIIIKIRKRPWYIWLIRVIWILLLLFWLEFTVGSWKEMEYRAFYISLTILITSFIAGLLIWLIGYFKKSKVHSP